MSAIIEGPIYVVGDNVDTDQIIPAQYLNLVPTIPAEYEKLGSYALIGLPEDRYPERFLAAGQTKTRYPIVIAGRNFGCGSSREHAPIALGASGARAVIAESYARIFFRNGINVGLPLQEVGPHDIQDGAIITLDLVNGLVEDETAAQTYQATRLPSLMIKVLDAGGLVNYLREHGDY